MMLPQLLQKLGFQNHPESPFFSRQDFDYLYHIARGKWVERSQIVVCDGWKPAYGIKQYTSFVEVFDSFSEEERDIILFNLDLF